MTNLRKYIYACGLAVLTFAAYSQPAPLSTTEAKEIILDLHKVYEGAVAAKDLTTIMTMYEVGAVYLPIQHEILEGKAQVKKAWERTFKLDLAGFDLELISVESSGEFLFEVGRTHSIFNTPNGQMPGEFKYLNVWRKQPDGQYRIYRAAYNQWVDLRIKNN